VVKSDPADEQFLIRCLAESIDESPLFNGSLTVNGSVRPSEMTRIYQDIRDRQFRQWKEAREKVDELHDHFERMYGLGQQGEFSDGFAQAFSEEIMEPLGRLREIVHAKTATPFERKNFARDRSLIVEAVWPVLWDLGAAQRAGARVIAEALVKSGIDDSPKDETIYKKIRSITSPRERM
jgi:hypothetical protein